VAITLAARRGGLDATLRGTILGLSGLFAVGSIALALGLAALTGRGGPLPVVALACVAIALVPLSAAASLPFQYAQAMHKVVALPFFLGLFRLGTAWLAWRAMRTVVGFQLSATLTGALSAALMLVVSRRVYGLRLRFDRGVARELLALAWPAAALEFVVMAYMRASYLLLHDAGARVQGEYAAADQLAKPVLVVTGALMASSLPTVAAIAAGREFDRLTRVFRTALVRALQVLVPLATGVFFLAPYILRKLAPDYVGATTPFRVLLVGTLFMCLNQLSSTFIVAMGRFRLFLMVAAVNFAVYLSLATRLIPRYQASGAAVATAVMEAVNTVMQLVIVAILLRHARRAEGAVAS
jgi:O-antigen/teichoic acid export membrane protein